MPQSIDRRSPFGNRPATRRCHRGAGVTACATHAARADRRESVCLRQKGSFLGGCLIAAAALLGLSAASSHATDDLCASLFIPDGYALNCTVEIDGGAAGRTAHATIEPTDSTFGELSRLTLHQLERRGGDAAAWTDPERWIRGQLVVNIDGLSHALEDLADNPDNPLGGPELTGAVQSAVAVLKDWSRLALRGCDDVAHRDDKWRLRCEWAAASLALYVQVLLVEAGDERYAVNVRTMNPRRLQHLEAIANSFAPSDA
ncbi:MAG: hypothetical protein AAFY56_13340 [Pseudomonadota bacterium]